MEKITLITTVKKLLKNADANSATPLQGKP